MSTSEEVQLPSYNELRRAHKLASLSTDARRLFWTLDGPLANSIWIMESDHNPDSLEPYFQGQKWHRASQSPLTEPKVSSITVHSDDINRWEDQWLDYHQDHSEPPDEDEEGEEWDSSMVQWGALPDYNEDEDEEGPAHLLMCCGTKRPRGKVTSVVVKPTSTSFVTVHDYLSTVHPWLLNMRGDLLAVMGLWDDKPLPPETKLMVDYNALESLKIYNQEEWVRLRRKRPNQLLDAMFLQQGDAAEKKMED
ncbi:hypothetical protein F4819DRAFT_469383 [Hypoxylon fuscum]|nr:hypothetical protein F4819DRAFT_469383 [Hypoxylon fuscum]